MCNGGGWTSRLAAAGPRTRSILRGRRRRRADRETFVAVVADRGRREASRFTLKGGYGMHTSRRGGATSARHRQAAIARPTVARTDQALRSGLWPLRRFASPLRVTTPGRCGFLHPRALPTKPSEARRFVGKALGSQIA